MRASADIRSPNAVRRLIVVLAMLAAFAPFATDMYLPAFAQLAAHFGSSHGGMESTLSLFFLGLAVGQFFYGPLIDRYGRRLPLLLGVVLFLGASLGCLLAPSLEVFSGMRFAQALGGCAGMIIGRAIVSDLFGPLESARVLSLLMSLMAFAPIVAPLLGGWILLFAGWQAIFVFLLSFAALCLGLVWRYVPETLGPQRRKSIHPLAVGRGYLALCRTPAFLIPAVVGGLAQACMFAFITGSPSVFMETFSVSEQAYGWLFGLNAQGLIVGAQVNRQLLHRHSMERLLGLTLGLNLAAGLTLVAVAGLGQLALLLLPLWLCIASLGLIAGNAAALAMGASGSLAGMGSALIGILQFLFAFLVSSLVAALQDGTAYPMSIAMALSGLLASGLWFMAQRYRLCRARR